MNKILLVANKGRFSEYSYESLKPHSESLSIVYTNEIESAYLKFGFQLSEFIRRSIGSENFNMVVYIGGEIWNVEAMSMQNFTIPKMFSDYCSDQGIKLIYLSSLSAYGDVGDILKVSENTRPGPSDSEYSRTKNEFDSYVRLNNVSSGYIAIQPSSIVGSRHFSSSLDRVILSLLKYKFLRYIEFSSIISFIDRKEILDFIALAIADGEKQGFYILSHNITISQVQRNIYHENYNPIFDAYNLLNYIYKALSSLEKVFNFLFFKNKAKVFKNLVNRTQYKSDRGVCNTVKVNRYISERCEIIKKSLKSE